MTERHGTVRIIKILRAVNDLRSAIRSHDPVASEAAWDRLEPWLDALFREKEGGVVMTRHAAEADGQ